MNTGLVFDVRKFSIHDGPGIRTAVFLKGCPLSCPWCHNPEGQGGRPAILRRPERCVNCLSCQKACPRGRGLDPRSEAGGPACEGCPDYGACARACPAEALQLVGLTMTSDELMDIIGSDRAFYDESSGGVTFTGGEPLSQPRFLGEVLDACKAEGIHSAIETSGYAKPEVFLDLARRADLILFDLKHAEARRGSELTGIDYELCLSNLARLASLDEGPEIVIRMPLIPGQNDAAEDVAKAAALVAGLPKISEVHILPYHESARGKYKLWGIDYPLSATRPPSEASIEAALGVFESRGIHAKKGG